MRCIAAIWLYFSNRALRESGIWDMSKWLECGCRFWPLSYFDLSDDLLSSKLSKVVSLFQLFRRSSLLALRLRTIVWWPALFDTTCRLLFLLSKNNLLRSVGICVKGWLFPEPSSPSPIGSSSSVSKSFPRLALKCVFLPRSKPWRSYPWLILSACSSNLDKISVACLMFSSSIQFVLNLVKFDVLTPKS